MTNSKMILHAVSEMALMMMITYVSEAGAIGSFSRVEDDQVAFCLIHLPDDEVIIRQKNVHKRIHVRIVYLFNFSLFAHLFHC